MKKAAIFMTLALLALGGQAFAELCTIDAVPAATLLLPYFEVDFTTEDDTAATTTFFSVNNASAAPALAHVTLFTNISIPTIDFDVYLTGYDVQVFNLRSIFRDGDLPVTATEGQDTAQDTISPHGINPAWDDASIPVPPIDPLSCNNEFPFNNPVLNSTLLTRIQNGHTGQAVPGLGTNQCLGLDVGKTNAIGYITIDSVSRCNVFFPNDAGYFIDGGIGAANNRNVLWGDYFIVDPANNSAFGDTLVHIEADATVFGLAADTFTFYSRDTLGADNREPLANAWATRYITGGAFDGGTRLAVWRDNRETTSGSVTCGSSEQLEEAEVIAWNESEDAVELCERGGNISPQPGDIACFPECINWVAVGEGDLDPPFNNGWLYLNLDLADVGTGVDPADRSQSYVTAVFSALNRYEVGYSAIQLHSACDGLVPADFITGNIVSNNN